MLESGTIRSHVISALSAYGAVVEERAEGLFEALLPEELAGRIGVNAGLFRFTFDPEAAAEEENIELLAFGSSLLSNLLDYGAARDRISHGYVTGLYLDDQRILSQVKRDVRVDGADVEFTGRKTLNVHFIRFTFHASFTSDVREEHIRSAAVDLSTGQLARQWESISEYHNFMATPSFACPDAAAVPLADAYVIARSEILSQLAPVSGGIRRAMEQRLREESNRIRNFYESYREEQEAFKARWADRPGYRRGHDTGHAHPRAEQRRERQLRQCRVSAW